MAAEHCKRVVGVELDPYLAAFARKRLGETGVIIECDMFTVNLDAMGATVLILYLLPMGLGKLSGILRSWLNADKTRRIITINYQIPEWTETDSRKLSEINVLWKYT
jgi:16S rRNA A1518/A1519 N6-dimethyltransferase RsmA/KsgA/DIM1 with predicted DNA glycosylase/AP lyase activity